MTDFKEPEATEFSCKLFSQRFIRNEKEILNFAGFQ